MKKSKIREEKRRSQGKETEREEEETRGIEERRSGRVRWERSSAADEIVRKMRPRAEADGTLKFLEFCI